MEDIKRDFFFLLLLFPLIHKRALLWHLYIINSFQLVASLTRFIITFNIIRKPRLMNCLKLFNFNMHLQCFYSQFHSSHSFSCRLSAPDNFCCSRYFINLRRIYFTYIISIRFINEYFLLVEQHCKDLILIREKQ